MNSLYKYICSILVIIFVCVCSSCNIFTNSCESNSQNECSNNELKFISILDSIEIDSIIIEYDFNRFGEFFKFELSRSSSFMVGHDYNPMVFNKKMTIKDADRDELLRYVIGFYHTKQLKIIESRTKTDGESLGDYTEIKVNIFRKGNMLVSHNISTNEIQDGAEVVFSEDFINFNRILFSNAYKYDQTYLHH